MALQPISPTKPTAAQMPTKPIPGIRATTPPTGISSTLRSPTAPFRGLPSLGVSDKKQPAAQPADKRFSTKFESAWNNVGQMTRYMMSYSVNRNVPKFNSAYVQGFTGFSDYWTSLMRDFGAGERKSYQTPSGSQPLYEYQYRNIMQFGDPFGPARSSSFEYRDGRWWNISRAREDYLAIKPTLPDGVAPYSLDEAEAEAVYHLARKNGLSSAAYSDLYKISLAKKYFDKTGSEISALTSVVTGTQGSPDIYNRMDFNEVYGSGLNLPDFSELHVPSVKDVFVSSLFDIGGQGLSAGLAKLTGATSSLGSIANLVAGVANSVFNALHYWVYPKKSAQMRREALYKWLWDYNENNRANRIQAIYDPQRRGVQYGSPLSQFLDIVINQNYNNLMFLTNQNGKIIDSYADITNGLDKQTVDVLYAFSGISPDLIAAQLGLQYRARAYQRLIPYYESYNRLLGSGGYFSDFGDLSFYGR